MVPTDAELVSRARGNEMGAFRQLVDRYKRRAYYTALGIVGNHHDAEDVMQESFLQALRSLDRLRNPGGFCAWLLRIAYNRSIDLRRRRLREVSPDGREDGVELFDTIGSESAENNPERSMRSGEIAGLVMSTMEKLPESQRVAFALKHIGQLSIKEIAAATGSTESTTKTNIYRAVQRMRKVLSPLRIQGSGVADERVS